MRRIFTLIAICAFSLSLNALAQAPGSKQNLDLLLAPIKSPASLEAHQKMTPSKDNPLNLLSPAARARFLSSVTFNEKGVTGFSYLDLKRELNAVQLKRVLSLFGSQSSVATVTGAQPVAAAPACYEIDPMKSGNVTPLSGCDIDWDGIGGGGSGSGGIGGVPHLPTKDYDNMECVKRATCGYRFSFICKENC
ncbi:MAG TPA: hypothetical protein VFS95_06120 [Telluria sp.]|nr:hypothetical protein [Telluria sp.]